MRWLVEREDRRFDARLGIAVGGVLEPLDLTVEEGDPSTGFTYVPSPVRVARWWLRELPRDRQSYTFVDLGSGKGRVLALAADAGFGSVVGVEFARELHEVALANAEAARERGVEFTPLLGDAGAFIFPTEPLVVHFNNPFGEDVLTRVIRNLEDTRARSPLPVVLVYQQLTHEQGMHATRNLELLDAIPFLTGRTLEPRGWIDRRALSPFTVRIFESPEAIVRRAQ